MSKKTIVILFIFISLPVIINFLWPSDESRIKKLFNEGTEAIEKEDLETVMSKVSFNYRDEYGLTYLYIKEMMQRSFQQMDNIKMKYEKLDIVIQDKKATAEMDVLVLGTFGNNTGYVLGDLSKPAHLKFSLEKERTKWLVTKTEGLPVDW